MTKTFQNLCTLLKKRGYDVKHVIFIKRGLKDREIIDLANKESRILITRDEDFVHLSRLLKTKVILIRKKIENKKIDFIVTILESVFNIEGKVIIIRENFVEVF